MIRALREHGEFPALVPLTKGRQVWLREQLLISERAFPLPQGSPRSWLPISQVLVTALLTAPRPKRLPTRGKGPRFR